MKTKGSIQIPCQLLLAALLFALSGCSSNTGSNNAYTGYPTWNPMAQSQILASSFSPDGHLLAMAAPYDGLVYIWDLRKEPIRRVLPVIRAHDASLAFTSDGQFLIGSFDCTIYKWALNSNQPPAEMTLPGGPHNQFGIVGPMVLSPDGSTIAVGAGQSIFLCDIQHLNLINTISIAQKNESLAFSPDGSLLAGCTWEFNQTDIPTGRVLPPHSKTSVWRVSDAKLIFAQRQQHYLISSVFFSQDGKSLVTLCPDPCVADIFNLSSGAFEKSVNLVNNPVTYCMPESSQLPKLCYTSRGNGQYNQSSLSQDQRLLATSVNGNLALFDTTRSPALPILRIVFFPTQRPYPLYDQHDQEVALPSPDQLAKSIAWFIDMPDPKDNHLQYWDGSPTSQRYVAWNLCATGFPGPTQAEINHRRRPDLIPSSLKENTTPAKQTALR